MRIAYLHCIADPYAARGGPGVHIASSTTALRALGHTVEVIGPTIDATRAPVVTKRERHAWRRAAASYVYEPRALVRSVWRARHEVPRVRAANPDVLLARYEAFEYAPIVIARALGVPLIWEVNGTSAEIPRWNPELVIYPGTRALERWALNAAAAIFVVSEELKDQLAAEGVRRERIAVIPNGADPRQFDPQLRAAGPPLAIPDDAVVVGYLGSFSSWHDVPTMLRLIPALAVAHPDLRFVLAGARVTDLGPEHQAALGALGDRVLLPGIVPIAEAARWMARFDIALSLYPVMESFYFSPVKLFEYMASGTAIVATDIGQQGQILRHGVNGMLTPPGDEHAARVAIEALVRDPALRRRIGEEARATLVDHYTWTHNARRIVSLCERVLSHSRNLALPGDDLSPSRATP